MSIQPMDWSATAAWIALGISIVGTIVGPIATTILTNRYQLKLRKLESTEKEVSEYSRRRRNAIEDFLSNTSRYLMDCHDNNLSECGKYFFQVYAYVPQELWYSLDDLYRLIAALRLIDARTAFLEISNKLTAILKETLPPIQ